MIPFCVSQATAELAALTQRVAPAQVGVYALLPDGQTLNWQGDRPLIPASAWKLVTTAAALHYLGGDTRFTTHVYRDRQNRIWLEGSGDPQFRYEHLQTLAAAVTDPVTALVPLPRFRSSGLGLGWEASDLSEGYAAPATAFTLHGNALDWTLTPGTPPRLTWDNPQIAAGWRIANHTRLGPTDTLQIRRSPGMLQATGTVPPGPPILGAMALPDPQSHILELFRRALPTPPPLQAPSPPPPLEPLAAIVSNPVRHLVAIANQDSDNHTAELLLRHIGNRGATPLEAAESGRQRLVIFLAERGLDPQAFSVADGSGLSRQNRITPRALTQLLQTEAANPDFRQSLAVAGQSGTLKNRLRHLNLQGKTGTLTGAATLAGYLTTPAGDIPFSVFLNQSPATPAQNRAIVDEITNIMAQVQRCPSPPPPLPPFAPRMEPAPPATPTLDPAPTSLPDAP
ncbi:MAG: D-alanyl-D-alanine carboxypeptidase/D-alanyl-D-alanine endopeptidase [Pseudanabaenaceae cyanobacterium]